MKLAACLFCFIVFFYGCAGIKPYDSSQKRCINVSGRNQDKIVVDIDRDFAYIPEGWPMGLSVGQTDAVGLSTKPYEILVKEPAYISSQVLYGYIPFGNSSDNKISFVIDNLEQETWIMYMDLNNNNDLSDDGPPLRNQGTGRLASSISLNVDIITSSGGMIQRPYTLWFWVNVHNGKKIPRFYSRCHYKGCIIIKGKEFTSVAFEMFKHDALYRESGLWIDLDNNGKLDKDKEHFNDGSAVTVSGKKYNIRLNYP